MTSGTNLTINPQRLWDSLMDTAAIGGTPKGGIKRLTVSDEDKKVRDWFKAECEKLGCTVEVDEVGNMFATRPGKRKDMAPIAMGSHLDTQPTGGKFDGNYGVLAGLEVVRTLNDLCIETEAPIEVAFWTNEEGSRFVPVMMGSGVFAKAFTLEHAYAATDTEGKTVQGELEGPSDQVAAMKLWLQQKGSPSSRIEKAVFKNERTVEKHDFESFEVRK